VLDEATFRSGHCDLFIVIGSSLVVYTAAYMPVYAVEASARLVIINLGPTPMDDETDVLIQARVGETMSAIIRKVAEKPAVDLS
jgi:NAD-dependent deacetylase